MAAAAASSKVISLKLLIYKKAQKVEFAEAGKDAVDFLFTILSLPVGAVIRLLSKQEMVGCLRNLYESVESLGEEYIQPNQNKDNLLKPKALIGTTNDLPRLMLDNTPLTSAKKFYKCKCIYTSTRVCFHNYVTDKQGALCPGCKNIMSTETTYVDGGGTAAKGSSASGERGFVKGVVTYMVTDDLVVNPVSAISSITLLNKFDVKDVGALEEKVVHLDMSKGLKPLKESTHSKNVLTSVFLGNKKDKNRDPDTKTTKPKKRKRN